MEKVLDWFTAARRKMLYLTLVPILGILAAHGFLTSDDVANIIESLGYLLGMGAVGLAHRNVNDN